MILLVGWPFFLFHYAGCVRFICSKQKSPESLCFWDFLRASSKMI